MAVRDTHGLEGGIPLSRRWYRKKPNKEMLILDFANSEDQFTFRPYSSLSDVFRCDEFYDANPLHDDASYFSIFVVDPRLHQSYIVSLQPATLPTWIDTRVGVSEYAPHRVMR